MIQKAKKSAEGLTQTFTQLPICVKTIAEKLGLRVVESHLGADVSGVLVLDGKQATIGYNNSESRVRNRFTIAHEIGHYMLHRNEKDVFVDKDFKALYRKPGRPDNYQRREHEANEFAAELLMPEIFVRKEVRKRGLTFIDYTDEEIIQDLARTFDVSTLAMSIRLMNLSLSKR